MLPFFGQLLLRNLNSENIQLPLFMYCIWQSLCKQQALLYQMVAIIEKSPYDIFLSGMQLNISCCCHILLTLLQRCQCYEEGKKPMCMFLLEHKDICIFNQQHARRNIILPHMIFIRGYESKSVNIGSWLRDGHRSNSTAAHVTRRGTIWGWRMMTALQRLW